MTNDLASRVEASPFGKPAGHDEGKANGDQERAKEQLEKLKALFSVALNSSEHGLIIFDAEHRLVALNNRFAEMYDLPQDRAGQGTPYSELATYLPAREAAPASAEPPADLIVLPDGKRVRVTSQPLPDGGWVETHQYADNRRRNEQQINWLARNDPLTEVGNPLYFSEELENALQQSQKGVSFALQWIDIDKFRDINKEYGEPVAMPCSRPLPNASSTL